MVQKDSELKVKLTTISQPMIEEKDEKHSIQESNILARPMATGYLRTAMYDANLVTLIDLPGA